MTMTYADPLVTDTDDGGVLVDFAPGVSAALEQPYEHNENLAEQLPDDVLADMASDILTGVEHDDASRAQWLTERAKGIDLLGVKIENMRSAASASGVAGTSRVKHPLMLDAVLRAHATARAELLPAAGPVKAKTGVFADSQDDMKANVLERAMNDYLTTAAPEYYPDSDRMLFQTVWSGAGFKKGYHCPLRRRPVIESVDAKDLIVSNDSTDLESAPRITHIISMDRVTLRRMQLAGAYLDVDLSAPEKVRDEIDDKIADVQGLSQTQTRIEDQQRTIYEVRCSYDIPGYEHAIDGELTGLPLPYKITIDYASRQILEIRRDWREDDSDMNRRKTFVMYPFVPMFGFYPTGLLHILGNATNAVTAAWRIMLDAGMFANFPGLLQAKSGNRQQNTTIRVAPGEAAPVDIGGTGDITKSVMPLPYKGPDAATMQLVGDIVSAGQRVGGAADLQVAEGHPQTPVGTILAQITQATVIMSAVHMRLHAAQAEELSILRDLLAEDPEALWRYRRDKARIPDELKMMVVDALNDLDLLPVANPNSPSHMHRMIKCVTLKQLQGQSPDLYDGRAVDEYCLMQLGFNDPNRFLKPPPPPVEPPEDPVKAMKEIEAMKGKVELTKAEMQQQTKDADRTSKENIERMKTAAMLSKQGSQ